MGGIAYIIRKTLKNSLKELKKRPAKLILYIVFIAFMVFAVVMGTSQSSGKLNLKDGYEIYRSLAVFSVLISIFLGVKGGMEKGSSFFRLSDVNFLFTAPISPQKVLLYGFLKQLYTSAIMIVLLLFQIPNLYNFFPVKSYGGLIVFFNIFLLVFSTSIIGVLVYSIASKSYKYKLQIRNTLYFLTGIFILGYMYNLVMIRDIKLAAFSYFSMKVFDYIPFAGWLTNIFMAAINGASILLLVYIILSIAFIGIIMYAIYSMNLDYYEEAISVTETKEEQIMKAKEGKVNINVGKDTKVRKIKSNLKAKGAKVIFQKQLLEYKKTGLIFIDKNSLILAFSSIIFAFFTKGMKIDGVLYFSIYMLLIFSSMGKWTQELNRPYIYLIPASSISKIFYATLTEHIKNFINGLVLFVPTGIMFKVDFFTIFFCALAYTSFGSVFIYADLVIRRAFGGNLSKGVEMFLKIILLVVIVMPGIVLSLILGSLFVNIFGIYYVYIIMTIYNILISFISILLSKGLFEKLEMS